MSAEETSSSQSAVVDEKPPSTNNWSTLSSSASYPPTTYENFGEPVNEDEAEEEEDDGYDEDGGKFPPVLGSNGDNQLIKQRRCSLQQQPMTTLKVKSSRPEFGSHDEGLEKIAQQQTPPTAKAPSSRKSSPSGSSSSNEGNEGNEGEDEPLDPRVQIELERLNKAGTDINKLEKELEEAKNTFFSSKNRQLQRLEFLQKKLGSCILKAKPYYEALLICDRLQKETLRAVYEYQKANSLYKTAKETLSVAEASLNSGEIPDAWQEHLSMTITKINLSKKAADAAEENHRNTTIEYQHAEQHLQYLEKDLKKNIVKSEPYYDEKKKWNLQMDAQKSRIHEIEQALAQKKSAYSGAMLNLSKISEEIHMKRRLDKLIHKLPPRGEPCVGAERPDEFITDDVSERLRNNRAANADNGSSIANNSELESSYRIETKSLDDRLKEPSTLSTSPATVLRSVSARPELLSPPKTASSNELEYTSLGLMSTTAPSSRSNSPQTRTTNNNESQQQQPSKSSPSRSHKSSRLDESGISSLAESLSIKSSSTPNKTTATATTLLPPKTPPTSSASLSAQRKHMQQQLKTPPSSSMRTPTSTIGTANRSITSSHQETPLLASLLLSSGLSSGHRKSSNAHHHNYPPQQQFTPIRTVEKTAAKQAQYQQQKASPPQQQPMKRNN